MILLHQCKIIATSAVLRKKVVKNAFCIQRRLVYHAKDIDSVNQINLKFENRSKVHKIANCN